MCSGWLSAGCTGLHTCGSRHVCVATGSALEQLVTGLGAGDCEHMLTCGQPQMCWCCCCVCVLLQAAPSHGASLPPTLQCCRCEIVRGNGVIAGPAAVSVMQAAGLLHKWAMPGCCWPCFDGMLCCADHVPVCVCGCRLAAPCLFTVVCSPHMWNMAWSESTGKHAHGCWARTPVLQAAAAVAAVRLAAAAAAVVAVAAAVTGGILHRRS